jgi:microcin C transport system substrate-binding protein
MIGRLSGLSIAAFGLALLAGGCNKAGQSGGGGGGNEGGRPKVEDKPVAVDSAGEADPIANPAAVKGGTYSTWQGGFPKSLNYWLENSSSAHEVSQLMFEPLIDYHSTEDRPVGILADSWTIAEDKKTFTVHLDPRARWSDGHPVLAEDIQFYYDVIMNPKNLTSIFRVGLSRFERPEIKDSLTLVFKAKTVHWANFWEMAGSVAFPKHAWEKLDFNEQNFDFPVVSGPYRIYEVKKERSLVLQRRNDWWGLAKKWNAHKFNFDYLKYVFIDDQLKTLEAFKKGDIDVYPIYTAAIWAEKTRFDQVQKGWIARQRVYNQEPKSYQGFALNMRRDRFQDPRVREALGLLINRKQMNEKLMFNEYFMLNSYFPSLYPDNMNPHFPLVEFDPAKARALFAAAGWKPGPDGILKKDGKPFTAVLLTHGSDLRHLNVYLEDLKAVGVAASIDQVSYSTLVKRMDNHDFDMYWANFSAGRLMDPEASWTSKTADEIASNNYPGVKDKVVDSLVELQKGEFDMEKQHAILRKLDDRLLEIKPYALLWQADHTRLLYWRRFGTPKYVLDKFNREDYICNYWWFDPAQSKALDEAMAAGKALPVLDNDVHYQD